MKWYAGENLPATHAKPTFSEAWFHRRFGFEFGERYFTDPIWRTEQDRQARRVLYERFGALGLGSSDPRPQPHLEICGHRFLPALLGCEIHYEVDQAPAARHLSVASAGELSKLPKPDLIANCWAREFRRQAQVLFDRYGHVDASINHGGPLNVASNTLGSPAFLWLAEASGPVREFLRSVAELCLETYDQLTLPFSQDRCEKALIGKTETGETPVLRSAGLDQGRELFIGNCPVMMLAPRTYREEVLPADQYLRRGVKRFGLHHCGPMDRYLEDYKSLAPCEYIEVGWGSTVSKVRSAFPTTTLDLMINIPAVQSMPPDCLAEALREMVAQAAPSALIRDIFMADLGPEVPDAMVENFVAAVNRAFGPGSSHSDGSPRR
jgi:hypothetical protein